MNALCPRLCKRCSFTGEEIDTTTLASVSSQQAVISDDVFASDHIEDQLEMAPSSSSPSLLSTHGLEVVAVTKESSTTSKTTKKIFTSSSFQKTTHCAQITCAYGITFDPLSCKCPCPPGFITATCSQYDCSARIEDDETVCPFISTCSESDHTSCPRKCFGCPALAK